MDSIPYNHFIMNYTIELPLLIPKNKPVQGFYNVSGLLPGSSESSQSLPTLASHG